MTCPPDGGVLKHRPNLSNICLTFRSVFERSFPLILIHARACIAAVVSMFGDVIETPAVFASASHLGVGVHYKAFSPL